MVETTDPMCVCDTFVEGVYSVENIGESCVRVSFYAKRKIAGGTEKVIVARLVWPMSIFLQANTEIRNAVQMNREKRAVMSQPMSAH